MAPRFSAHLQNVISGIFRYGQLANAYLFSGPEGAFVEEAALYFAHSLHCETHSACGACNPCRSIQNESHPGFLSIRSEKPLSIDAIRTLQESIKYGPTASQYLTVIVYDVDQFSIPAANAFLKTLEEPPDSVIFILVTHNRAATLQTIQSRCQHLVLPKLSREERKNVLAQLSPDENDKISQHCHSNSVLIDAYLDSKIILPFDYIPLATLLQKPASAAFELAADFSTDKNGFRLLSLAWLEEVQHLNNLAQHDRTCVSEILVENIRQLHYNVNLKLHIEASLLQLICRSMNSL